MTPLPLLETWEPSLGDGPEHFFSPSGHALAWQPLLSDSFMATIEVAFADKRPPLVMTNDGGPVTPLAWASDEELVYRVWGQPLGTEPAPALCVLSVASGQSRFVREIHDTTSEVWAGKPGHLSVLTEPKGVPGLFDLNINTGAMERIPAFDAALSRLEVYPLFGHSFCAKRNEAVLVAWPKGDFLPDGVEPTWANSEWSPLLDAPFIQNCVSVQADGTRITQRELTAQAKRQTPPRLFVLNGTSGDCQEIPNTHHAHRPQWSLDGTLFSFERHDHFDPINNKSSFASVWAVRRDDFLLMRLGGGGLTESSIMHPSGTLLCELENEVIPADAAATGAKRRWRRPECRWAEFILRNGEVGRPNAE